MRRLVYIIPFFACYLFNLFCAGEQFTLDFYVDLISQRELFPGIVLFKNKDVRPAFDACFDGFLKCTENKDENYMNSSDSSAVCLRKNKVLTKCLNSLRAVIYLTEPVLEDGAQTALPLSKMDLAQAIAKVRKEEVALDRPWTLIKEHIPFHLTMIPRRWVVGGPRHGLLHEDPLVFDVYSKIIQASEVLTRPGKLGGSKLRGIARYEERRKIARYVHAVHELMLMHSECIHEFKTEMWMNKMETAWPSRSFNGLMKIYSTYGFDASARITFEVARNLMYNGKHQLPWEHFEQRPNVYYVGRTASPFWNFRTANVHPNFQKWVDYLESIHRYLKRDLQSFLAKQAESTAFSLQYDHDLPLNLDGWAEYLLYDKNAWVVKNCNNLRAFCALLLAHEEKDGKGMNGIVKDQITVFRLKPYSWLLPHFGPHNDRLIWHLCIVNCKGPKLRVGNTWREWEEGKVIVFDDSFEHEVQWPRPGQPLKKYGVPPSEMDEAFIEADEENTTPVQGEPRYVLFMALQHPDTLAVPPEVPVFSLDDFRSLKLEL